MGDTVQCGMEVRPGADPETIAQPYPDKCFVKAEEVRKHSLDPPAQSGPSDRKSQKRRNAFRGLALITVLCVAVGLGAGLGTGLATRHKIAVSSSESAATSAVAISPVFTTARAGKAITRTSMPSILPTTQSGQFFTKTMTLSTLTPSNSPMMPSPACPAADRSTYTATNRPSLLPTPIGSPELQITNTSLAYEILCYTNFIDDPPIIDLQTLTDVPSLHDCLDACALYSFQTKPLDFPAYACTGIAWERVASGAHICWLKSNVTLSSTNGTSIYPGMDRAVMVL